MGTADYINYINEGDIIEVKYNGIGGVSQTIVSPVLERHPDHVIINSPRPDINWEVHNHHIRTISKRPKTFKLKSVEVLPAGEPLRLSYGGASDYVDLTPADDGSTGFHDDAERLMNLKQDTEEIIDWFEKITSIAHRLYIGLGLLARFTAVYYLVDTCIGIW